MMRRLLPSAALLLLAACGAEPAATPAPPATAKQGDDAANDEQADDAANTDAGPLDDGGFGDLIAAPGSELVVQHCIACHGPRQFLQQRGSRDTWRGLIRWMQKDHGMAKLDEAIEDRIVDYLATHYAPEESGRRKPLPSELMPPNPYAGGK